MKIPITQRGPHKIGLVYMYFGSNNFTFFTLHHMLFAVWYTCLGVLINVQQLAFHISYSTCYIRRRLTAHKLSLYILTY